MATIETNGIPPDVMADAEIVARCLATGQPIPPDVARRVQERADQARKQLLATHGIQSSGVQIIREMRGEIPEP